MTKATDATSNSRTRRSLKGAFELCALRKTDSPPENFSTTLRRAISPIVMSSDPQTNAQNEQSHSSAVPYNPLTTASHETGGSAVGNSVVQDLMRVYESLTQSSTPQTSAEQGGRESQKPPQQQQQQQPGYDQQPPLHQYPPPHHPPSHGVPPQMHSASYPIPPPVYHHIPQPQYQPSPGQPQNAPPQYYGDQAYGHQQPYMVPPPDHLPQHGYPAPAHEPVPEHGQQTAHDQDDEDGDDSEEPEESTGRSRRKRRGSDSSGGRGGPKGRKKSKSTDGRWSKRFTWPEDLHRDFVSAIFDVGLKHSSPATILEHMPKHEQITTERIKSHLQKYRLHRVKSKKEFMASYESSLRNLQTQGPNNPKTVSNGDVAAHLSHTSLNNTGKAGSGLSTAKSTESVQEDAQQDMSEPEEAGRQSSDSLMLPQLSEAEKQSPIGAAMGYLMGLFFSLKQQLMIQRAMEAAGADEKAKGNAPVQDVFNSFVAGSAPAAAASPAECSVDSSLQHGQSFDGSHSSAKPASQVLSAPSVRTNIEENSMMKREMQHQMALQNKMRALKQQELNKYKNIGSQHHEYKGGEEKASPDSHMPLQTKEDELASRVDETAANRFQGAGEPAGNDGVSGNVQRQRHLSIGASDEFWNTDVVDEQLFEFLMNN